jgi:ASC-1-like (ASCH) protein
MTGPYLQALLEGRKTIESRFTRNRVAPFEQVRSGDVVFFKPAATPVLAAGFVTEALHIRLADVPLTEIARQFGEAIAPADQSFWIDRAEARFATLLTMGEVINIPPISIAKRDRRGWVVLNSITEGTRHTTLF